MNRVQKRFLEKIFRTVFIPLAVLAMGTITHFVAAYWGYTLAHVIAYVGIVFAYILVPVLIAGALIFAFGITICDKWREAQQEVAQENQQLVEVIRND